MIICRSHPKLALSVLNSHPSKDLWFPLYSLKADQCYDEATHYLLNLVLSCEQNLSTNIVNDRSRQCHQKYSDPQLLHTMRIQIPHSLEFITRALFFTEPFVQQQ